MSDATLGTRVREGAASVRARGLRGRGLLVAIALLAIGVLLGPPVFRALFGPPEQPELVTATVSRRDLNTVVTAAGTVVPLRQQSLGFLESGRLTEVNVKVGDRVTPGQVLARIDPSFFEANVEREEAELRIAQADLDNTLNGNAVKTARHALTSARKALDAAKRRAKAIDTTNLNAIRSAERQLAFDRRQLEQDEARLRSDQEICSRGTRLVTSPRIVDTDDTNPARPRECARIPNDEERVRASRAKVIEDQASLRAARDRRRVDQAAQRVEVQDARAAVVTAEDELKSQTVDRKFTIASQRAAVSAEGTDIDLARLDVADTVLIAPVLGTVASVSGSVGESVQASADTTSLAPGTDAAVPGQDVSGTIAPGTGAPLPDTVSSNGGGGGGPFIVLDNVDSFQVVTPFAEADAAQIQADQDIEVTFDAIEGVTRRGKVLSVAPAATTIDDVTNYYVTAVLDELHPKIKAGQAANVSVIVDQAANALTVPNAAIQRPGPQTAFVSVLQPDGTQQPVQIQTGTVGETDTEVLSGLQEGQKIVIPQVRGSQG